MEMRAANVTVGRPGKLHLTHVEGLRALAALVVYLNHAYAQAFIGATADYSTGVFSLFRLSMIGGHLAVSVFIVISGFCLTLPVVDGGDRIRGSAREFFKRRARRILPPYYGALFLALALIFTVIGDKTGTLWDVPIAVDWKAIVAHVALVQDFFRTGRINYVFWSIAVEWQIYFLFPALVWATRRFGIVRVALSTLVVAYAVRFGFDGSRIARANPHYVGLFGLGMLAAYITRSTREAFVRARSRNVWGWLAGALLLLTLGLSLLWGTALGVARFHYLDLPTGVMAMAVLIHSSASPTRLLTRVLNLRPLVFIGTFSYSLYLVHAPLLQIMWQYIMHPLGLSRSEMFVTLMTAGLAAVLVFTYGFFKLCEEPFMRSARTGTLRETANVAPAA